MYVPLPLPRPTPRPGLLVLAGLLSVLLGALLLQVPRASVPSPSVPLGQVAPAYGRLPLAFEANQGQSDAAVRFLARGAGYTLFLTPNEAALTLQPTSAQGSSAAVVRLQWLNANPNPAIVGEEALPGTVSYLMGEPEAWHTAIPTFRRVAYRALYPGVDLHMYGNPQQLEYDFVVAPGADPGQIRLRFAGAEGLELDAVGNLRLHTPAGTLIQQAPVVYQEQGGTRQPVAGRYELHGGGEVGFALGAYDATLPLVIDPVVVYSTFLGGGNFDAAYGVVVDGSGAAYVTGRLTSNDFPYVAGGYRVPNPGGFVVKFTPAGDALMYTAFIASTGNAIVLDSAGNAVVGGWGVLKLNASGTALIYEQRNNMGQQVNDVALDAAGNAYVVGTTDQSSFTPTPGAFQTTYGGWYSDAFVAKVDTSGNVVYGSYLGGNRDDYGEGITVDAAGNAFVTGYAWSWTGFPIVNAFQPQKAGDYDAFLTKVVPNGSTLVYSTYLGGTGREQGHAVALDSANRPHVTGFTESANFPTRNPLRGAAPLPDVFVTKFNDSGSDLVYSTYLGGGTTSDAEDEGWGIAVDHADNAVIAGRTNVPNYPVTGDAPQGYAVNSNFEVIVSKLSPNGQQLLFSTYLGGSLTDAGWDVAVDGEDSIYVVGDTSSYEFPTVNPFQATSGLAGEHHVDGFVSKLSFTAPPQPLVNLKLSMADHSNIVHGSELVTYTLTVQNLGPDLATGVQVVSRPAFLNVISITPSQGTCSGVIAVYHVLCELGTVASGGSAQVRLVIRAPNINSGAISVDAFTSSEQLDTDNRSNYDREVTHISDTFYTLTVAAQGNGSVRTVNIEGINCPPDCTEPYLDYQFLTLRAAPAPGATFVRWEGGCSGTAITCELTIMGNLAVTAIFSGGFTPTPPPTPDPSTATATATRTAVPPTATATRTPTSPPPTATFPGGTYLLTVEVVGPGRVRSSNVAGILCPGDCTEAYSLGQDIFLEAVPDAGVQFVGWQGPCAGTGLICSVHMTEPRLVRALFTSGGTVTPTTTGVPPSATLTATSMPPTATLTATSMPPTATRTTTRVPPTATRTPPTSTPAATGTLPPATPTGTRVPPSATGVVPPVTPSATTSGGTGRLFLPLVAR